MFSRCRFVVMLALAALALPLGGVVALVGGSGESLAPPTVWAEKDDAERSLTAPGGALGGVDGPFPVRRNPQIRWVAITRWLNWEDDRPTEDVTAVAVGTPEVYIVLQYHDWTDGDRLSLSKYVEGPDGWQLLSTRSERAYGYYGRNSWIERRLNTPGHYAYVVGVNWDPSYVVTFDVQ